jgi:hypothetical protein
MATKKFTTWVQLENYLQSACTKAIENTAKILCAKLSEFIIEDYYQKYEPLVYQRTYQFLNSASQRLLSPTSAEIYMDETAMSYGNYWDGETQLYMADAGFHGSAYIFREGFFWKDFLAYCDENAISILRKELAKQGIKTVK